ncbi:MAG TPA: sigma-70 family RNA polymerase sigma factor [Polyangiaceae bacterium]
MPKPSKAIEPGATLERLDHALDPEQLAHLLVLHFPRAWRVARRLGLGSAQAEEAAQEAFIVMLQKIDRIEPGKELPYLLSAVAAISQNLRRKASFLREATFDPQSLENASDHDTSFELLARKQARELVDSILQRLSEPLRVVFVLYEFEQLTLQEIAEALDVPLGTAGSRLRLARQAFKKELEHRNYCTAKSHEGKGKEGP